MSESSEVQPETSAKCPLRDRYAEALVSFEPSEYEGCPDLLRRFRYKAADAVLAVRDDVLAEGDAVFERLVVEVEESRRRIGALIVRAEEAEAEVARLRETVGRVEAVRARLPHGLGQTISDDYRRGYAHAEDDVARDLDVALGRQPGQMAPRESASEAPRTRDGEQGGER